MLTDRCLDSCTYSYLEYPTSVDIVKLTHNGRIN